MKLSISALLQQGNSAYQKGKFREAKKIYDIVLETEPNNLDALNNLGVTLTKLNKLDKAIICFRKAIKLKSSLPAAHNNLGRLLLQTNKLNEAEICFNKAVELKPDYYVAYNNLGITSQKLQKFENAEACFKKVLEIKPDSPDVQYRLGVALFALNKPDDAEACFKKVLEIKPNHFDAQYSLGTALLELGKIDNAEVIFKKLLKLKPDSFETHNALGNTYNEIGKLQEAEASFKKSLSINPDYVLASYNLGLLFHITKQNKKAAELFKLINFKHSKEFLLKCFFDLNEQVNFYSHLDSLTNAGENNAVIGSLISRSRIRYGVDKLNPFCNEPLNYVLKSDLASQGNFKNIFVKTITNILNDNNVKKKFQSLLTKGFQTSGNIFNQKNEAIDKIKRIIYSEIQKYRTHFYDSEEGFLKKWPTDFYINGWIVSMKSGGNLSPHMHELGWLSGSIYINVPPKSKTDNGNLVVCIERQVSEKEKEKDKNIQKIIDVVTGSLCLFPSSLLHYTIPFSADEDRIVLAFDVIPK